MNDSLKAQVVKGTIWAMLTKVGTKVLSFIVTLVLARLLTPSDYGTISLLTIFITIASTLAESGFGRALIQKKDATQADFDTIFYTSLVMSGLMYAVMFISAPAIARFYETSSLVSILRVLSLTLLFNAINGVQNAELSRNFRFDIGFRVTLVSSAASAIVGIVMAFLGFGPWALVAHTISAAVASTIMLWLCINWRPKLEFSLVSLRELWGFSWKLTASSLIDTIYNNIYGLVIGKLYSKEDLAYVNKGQSVPCLAMEMVTSTLGATMFPALTKLQDDIVRFQEGMRRMIQFCMLLILPLMVGVAVCAPRLVVMMFGSQWVPCIPFVQIACFSFALWPIHVINLSAITALGRSDVYLKLEIIKKIVGVLVLAVSVPYGVFAMLLASAFVSGPICLLINAWPNRKLLGYTLGMQIRDIMPMIGLSMAMGAFIMGISWFVGGQSPWLLCSLVPSGIVFYAAMAYLFRLRTMGDALRLISPFFEKRTNGRIRKMYAFVLSHFAK